MSKPLKCRWYYLNRQCSTQIWQPIGEMKMLSIDVTTKRLKLCFTGATLSHARAPVALARRLEQSAMPLVTWAGWHTKHRIITLIVIQSIHYHPMPSIITWAGSHTMHWIGTDAMSIWSLTYLFSPLTLGHGILCPAWTLQWVPKWSCSSQLRWEPPCG